MTSDTSNQGELEMNVMKRRRKQELSRRKVSAGDIEELTSAGHGALKDGHTDDALSCFKDAVTAAQQLQDSKVLRACSFNLGAAYVEAGHPQKGLTFLQQAELGPKAERIPDLQFNLALAHNALGRSQKATTYFLQAANLYRSQGAGSSEGDACMEMGLCYGRTQEWALAVHACLRAAESYKVAAMLDCAATALKEAGGHMVQSDQFSRDDVVNVLTECLSLTDGIKDPWTLANLYQSVGTSFCRLRCFQEAVHCFQAALGPAAQWPPLLAKVLHNLGAALNSVGSFTQAVGFHRLATGLYGSLGRRGDQAQCFSNLAFAYSKLGNEEDAAESLIHALQGFRDTEEHLAQVQVCESLAEFYLKQQNQQKAVQLYKEALTALSHCENSSAQLRDHLVDRLTAALQQSLTRPRPPMPHPPRLNPYSSPVRQPIRKSDSMSNHTPEQKGEESGAGQEVTGRQEVGGDSDQVKHESVAPGLNSLFQSDQFDQLQHSQSLRPNTPGELWSDREVPPTESETSVAEPTGTGELVETPPPTSKGRSRLCSLM